MNIQVFDLDEEENDDINSNSSLGSFVRPKLSNIRFTNINRT